MGAVGWKPDPAKELMRNRRRKATDRARLVERRGKLMREYRMTLEQFDALLAAQGGRCAICRTDDPRGGGATPIRNFCVDHCHRTGKVRGLLCLPCNKGLGHFRDSPSLLISASRYLEEPKANG